MKLLFTHLLELSLQLLECSLLLLYVLANNVELLSEVLKSVTDLSSLFTTGFPGWNEVVRLEEGISLHMRYFVLLLLCKWDGVILLELTEFEFVLNGFELFITLVTDEVVALLGSNKVLTSATRNGRLWLVLFHLYL